jgi:hypothetical protein
LRFLQDCWEHHNLEQLTHGKDTATMILEQAITDLTEYEQKYGPLLSNRDPHDDLRR